MARWETSLAQLAGILIPDGMVIHFTIEMARWALEIPPYIPFITGDLGESPWMPADPCFDGATTAGGTAIDP